MAGETIILGVEYCPYTFQSGVLKPMSDSSAAPAAPRLLALDAYRGFVMLALASGGLGIAAVSKKFPDSRFWNLMGHQFEHVEWVGCSFWDLIQPSFMFIVGVSMAYSYAARAARGQSYRQMLLGAARRALILVLLGIFLRSASSDRTNWTFIDVLTQIGLGYVPLFLLWNRPARVQMATACLILVAYWVLFYFYPLPGPNYDFAKVGVPVRWEHLEKGTMAHWNKNTNPAAAFDRWFLNLLPRWAQPPADRTKPPTHDPPREPFRFEPGGYATLNFIPSIATMTFGLVAGEFLRRRQADRRTFWMLMAAGLLGVVAGLSLHALGVVPIVKRIWTPSWVLFSTGLTTWMLAGFYGVVEVLGFRRWTYPLVVVGANSIVIYAMSHLSVRWIGRMLQIHLGRRGFELFGSNFEPLVRNLAVLAVLWLVCWWLYRQRIFVRI